MGGLLEKVPIPKDDDPKFETWEAENSMIMPWLLHSMQPKISKSLLFLSTAKEIWLMTGTGPLSTIHNGICCCSTAEVD
ncbi:hypothetical protein CK203_052516 [Vitis vinifera]|uniref:Retrotransposon Copia-like N-terminal domain-containing protein n=1 Tax=Vitis vinifera TaxID=29760 RepID=A0A438GIB0_VITVI|nr:hypothetical protein CK203_052516 [Vitis vinifera]